MLHIYMCLSLSSDLKWYGFQTIYIVVIKLLRIVFPLIPISNPLHTFGFLFLSFRSTSPHDVRSTMIVIGTFLPYASFPIRLE